MTLSVVPVTESFAAEVADVDLSAPLDDATLAQVKAAFATYAVLIFPGQQLNEAQQIAFSRYFGPIEDNLLAYNKGQRFRVDPELIDISNLDPDNRIWAKDSRIRGLNIGNQLWHTDSSFKYLPALASLLYARAIPPVGGNTEFADLRAAWDALPPAQQERLEGLIAEHAFETSRRKTGFLDFTDAERERLPPVPQVLVRTIPESGRRSLYLASHAGRIYGLPDAEAVALLEELMAHATEARFCYEHRWRVGDLVMWDNRCTMHRGRPYDDQRYVRDMLRGTVSDVANTCEQVGIAPPRNAAVSV